MIQSAVALNSEGVKALLRDHRAPEDVLEAVLALHESGRLAHAMGDAAAVNDLANVFRWADALARLLETGEGLVLLATYRRADDVLREAEAKDEARYVGKPQPALFRCKEERELAVAISLSKNETAAALTEADFERAMRAVSVLRPYIQAFFDKVAFDSALMDLRENRLFLVNELRCALGAIGDFSKIEPRVEVA